MPAVGQLPYCKLSAKGAVCVSLTAVENILPAFYPLADRPRPSGVNLPTQVMALLQIYVHPQKREIVSKTYFIHKLLSEYCIHHSCCWLARQYAAPFFERRPERPNTFCRSDKLCAFCISFFE